MTSSTSTDLREHVGHNLSIRSEEVNVFDAKASDDGSFVIGDGSSASFIDTIRLEVACDDCDGVVLEAGKGDVEWG